MKITQTKDGTINYQGKNVQTLFLKLSGENLARYLSLCMCALLKGHLRFEFLPSFFGRRLISVFN